MTGVMDTGTFLVIMTLINAGIVIFCGNIGYQFLFRTKEICAIHLKNRHRWYMRGAPNFLYKEKNYMIYLRATGIIIFVLLIYCIIISFSIYWQFW
jgi:hypothetical protein